MEVDSFMLKLMHDAIWNTTIVSIAIISICTVLMVIEWCISREDRRLAAAPEVIRNFLNEDPANYPHMMALVPKAQKRVIIHNIVFYITMLLWFIAILLFFICTLFMTAVCSPQVFPALFDWVVNFFTLFIA